MWIVILKRKQAKCNFIPPDPGAKVNKCVYLIYRRHSHYALSFTRLWVGCFEAIKMPVQIFQITHTFLQILFYHPNLTLGSCHFIGMSAFCRGFVSNSFPKLLHKKLNLCFKIILYICRTLYIWNIYNLKKLILLHELLEKIIIWETFKRRRIRKPILILHVVH